MSPRRYRLTRRAAAKAQTRERIIAAAVELHREQGAVATGYAALAERAGVTLQTVHNHFPTLEDLLPACTGMVAAEAPPLSAETFRDLASPEERLDRLMRDLFRQHAHLAPWMRWAVHEAHRLPSLDAILRQGRARLAGLIAQALSPHDAGTPSSSLVALLGTWLDIECWMRLQSQSGLSAAAAGAAMREGALAILRDHRSASIEPAESAKPLSKPDRSAAARSGDRP